MTETPADRYGIEDDEQQVEVDEWNDDLGRDHVIAEDDPAHRDTIAERMRREAPEREREPREGFRLVQVEGDGEELADDVGNDSGGFSAEERAMHIEPDA